MKKILIMVALFIMFPFVVDAAVTSSLTCTKEKVISSDTFSCNVTITPTDAITSFKTNINYPTDFTLTKITPASNWTSNSTSIIDLQNDNYGEGEGLTNSLNIATLYFKVNSNVSYGQKTIKINGFDLSDEASYNINILSSNNLLSSLTIAGIDFDFSSRVNTYNLSTTKNAISISAALQDTNSTFKEGYGSRTINLNYGKNTIQVITVSQSCSTNTYTLNIDRLDQRSSNNNLSALIVSEGTMTPTFDKNNLSYEVAVATSVSSIAIEAKKEVSSSAFVAGYGPRTVDLQKGLNTFTIQVRAENGTIKTYTLNIIRSEKSSNNFLKSLRLTNATINFDKNILQYEVNVLYNVLEMEVIAVPEDMSAKVEIVGNKSLIIGPNVYTVNIVAQNGSILTYKIIVNRLEEGRTLSENNYLSELIINNYELDFNKEVNKYSLKIEEENRLSISYTPEDTNAKVLITGNNALKNGSKINIDVTSESGLKRTYVIDIEKEENNFQTYLYVLLAVIAIILSLILIFKDKMFKKKDKQIISQDIKLGSSKLVLNSKKTKKENDLPTKPEVVNIPEEPGDEIK